MTWANNLIASPDLFLLVIFAGMVLCGINAVATREGVSSFIHNLHQMLYVALAIMLGWSLVYAYRNGWAPWPPDLLFFIVFDALLVVRLLKRQAILHAQRCARENCERRLAA